MNWPNTLSRNGQDGSHVCHFHRLVGCPESQHGRWSCIEVGFHLRVLAGVSVRVCMDLSIDGFPDGAQV